MKPSVTMEDNSAAIFCRICLRIDLTQKYILSDIVQRNFIETIFKENGYFKDLEERSYACFECRTLLHRSYNFIQKALRAQKALYELQEKQEPLTNSLLQSVDREKYNINSNLACCEPKTYVLQPVDIVCKLKGNVFVKTELSESQDDINSSLVKTIDQNSPNNYQPDSSFTCELDSKYDIHIDPNKSELTTVDTEWIPNHNSYIDPHCNGDVKTEPEIYILDDADVQEYKYLDDFDPLDKQPTEDKSRRNSSVIEIISSDNSCTIKKVKKCKGKKNKKKKDNKKLVSKRKVTLVFLSDDEVKRKRKKVKWPEMPIFEERFRTRKNLNYSGLDDIHEGNADNKKEKKVKKKPVDEDFVPTDQDSSDESADNSYDSYDDDGKVIKRKQDTREFPMECEECESIITSRKEHQYHYLHMHRDAEYPYKNAKCLLCPHCGERVSRLRLREHETRHAGIKIKCDICHKEYCSKRVMMQHKRRVHRIGTLSLHVCDYCRMSFFTKADLIRHIRTHTGEKPFKCNLCDYRVAHKGNLYVHVRQFHQHMGTTSKKPARMSKESKKKNTDEEVNKKNLDENNSGKEDDNRSKRKIKDGGGKKKKRKRQRKVATDSDTE